MASASLDTVSLSRILDDISDLSSSEDEAPCDTNHVTSSCDSASSHSLNTSWSSDSSADSPREGLSSCAPPGAPVQTLSDNKHVTATSEHPGHENAASIGSQPRDPVPCSSDVPVPMDNVDRAPSPDQCSSSLDASSRPLQSPIGSFYSPVPPEFTCSDFVPPGYTGTVKSRMSAKSAISIKTSGSRTACPSRSSVAAVVIKSGPGSDDDEDDDRSYDSSSSDSECPDSESHPEVVDKASDTAQPRQPPRQPPPASPVIQPMSPVSVTSPPPVTKGKENLKIDLDLLALSPPPESTRSPSPLFGRRSPRGALGWRPVMPGYHPPKNDSQKLMFGGQDGSSTGRGVRGPEMSLKDYIPVMPRPLAIFCLVLNVISPGLGTLFSGVSVVCCSTPRPAGTDRLHCLSVNTWVSVLQLLTTFLVLLGWIWSIMWGVAFLSISGTLGEENKDIDRVQAISSRVDSGHSRHNMRTEMSTDRNTSHSNPMTLSANYYRQSMPTDNVPMIVLQDTPLVLSGPQQSYVPTDTSRSQTTQRSLNPYNPRHQRMLMRRHGEDVLPSYLLDGQALENIVIRNAPVPDQMVFGRQEPPQRAPPPETERGLPKEGYSDSDLHALGEQLGADSMPSSSNQQTTPRSRPGQGHRSHRHRPPPRRESQQNLL